MKISTVGVRPAPPDEPHALGDADVGRVVPTSAETGELKNEEKLYQLGILFVHGVGSQPAGETLVKWGDVLLKTIRRATNNQVKPRVDDATIGSADGSRPHAIVSFSAGEKWLIADGWWAGVFPPPSYAELV